MGACSRIVTTIATSAAIFAAASVSLQRQAEACGCFTPPDPSVPIVQAGERIVFAMEDGEVTSHIQIQYSGPAEEFGWLLPLPSIPELEVGTDELFTQVINATQPQYLLNAEFRGNCNFPQAGGFGASGDSSNPAPNAPEDGSGPGTSVVVIEDTVGPFDFAVLRADSKQPMLDWLEENRYFVPEGTDGVVAPYIREGAYFLALKLRKGKEIGDLQPVVVKYASDLPMIPIVLTSVAADPDMGVQVWVLGDHRAIPFNYFHTHINDARLDWLQNALNYVSILTEAVDEADGHHSFVTEYAGTSDPMVDVLDYPGRFGDLNYLRTVTNPIQYLAYLRDTGFATSSPNFGFAHSSQTLSILQGHLPLPAALEQRGVTANDYYLNPEYWLGSYREDNPEDFGDLDLTYDPNELTTELDKRIVQANRDAGQLFRDNPYMTRMFTTLSPEEMTKDPVFSFNPDLPEVNRRHEGQVIYHCGVYADEQGSTPATIITEAGYKLHLPDGTDNNPWLAALMPGSQRIEILREEGPPEVVVDNDDEIRDYISSGCQTSGGAGNVLWLVLVGLLVAGRRRR